MDTETRPNPLNLPPVVKAVFKFLPAKALCSAASVCSLWKGHAQRCLQQRQQYGWHYLEQESSVTCLQKMQQYFEEIAFRPTVVVVFMTADLWEYMGRHRNSNKRKLGDSSSRTAWKRFCNTALPLGCQVFCSVSGGIVGTTSDLSVTTEKDFGRVASVLCFGQYPGVQVSLKKSRGNVHCLFNNLPNGDDVKLLLLMSCFAGASFTIEDIQRELPRTLIVGGIIVTSCVYGVPTDVDTQGANSLQRQCMAIPYCVVFRGAGVRVACVKLDSDISQVDKAEQVIQRLKDKTRTFDLRHSVGFMYACVARGYSLYSRHNVETSLFRKHFPTTPLFGLFGNGEIGCEFPVSEEGGGPGKSVDMQHAYTTFITVVSLP